LKGDVVILATILVIAMLEIVSLTSFAQQQEYTGKPMNASISQPICIQISDKLAEGIFFTNETTIGVQYPITNMKVWNNATQNYAGPSSQTLYNVTACSGNTINVTIYHCACDNLKCSSGTCTPGVDQLYVEQKSDGGVGWVNGTTATPGDTPSYYFPGIDTYQIIGGKVDKGDNVYLRYWINPSPDNAPSGVYNTTFSIRAEEFGSSTPTCSC